MRETTPPRREDYGQSRSSASPLRDVPSPQPTLDRLAPSPQPLPREDQAPSPLDPSPGALEKARQKGRQSGRFRKSSTNPNLASAASPSSTSAQSQYLASLVTPAEEATRKSSTVSRTDSYRRARGEPPKRGEQYSSLPRRGGRAAGGQLQKANSEDSVREAIARQEQSRSRRGKEKGDCSVM